MSTSNWIGTFGMFLILLAYGCNTFRLLSSQTRLFFTLHAIGASMACLSFFLSAYWSIAVLKGVWAMVSVIGLVRVSSSNRR